MKLNFDLNNKVENPEIILAKRNYDKLGSIMNITDLDYDDNLMSATSISFVIHKNLDNIDERLWNEIRDRRLIYVKEYKQWFEIEVNINEESELKKEITGTSLCEAELSQLKITVEINTEDDIERDDYENPTIFYKPSSANESLLHRILKKAPNYTIEYVDSTLWNIQRMFSISDKDIYSTLTEDISNEIGCLFLFNSNNRSISVYDLETNCLECGYRGNFTDICPECGGDNLNYGYGYDTSIFIDSETLAQNISLTGKQDEVKNYIKVIGGDDVINTAITACNPSGTQYIYSFSNEDKEDMSDELLTKLDEYLNEYDRLTPDYKEIMSNMYDKIDKELELESSMMPDIEQAETNAELELKKLNSATLSPVAVQDIQIASIYTVNNAVIGLAKCVINSSIYSIEIVENSSTYSNNIWKGKFRVENCSNEDDYAENTEYIQLTINDDYEYYIKQKIKKTIDRDDVYLVDIFDIDTDLDDFKSELKKYCLERLKSFESAYQTIIDTLLESNVSNDSIYVNLYNELYIPYLKKITAIKEEYNVRESEIEIVKNELENLENLRTEITSYLNLENFLGDELWKELCAFRREDSYENSNYVSDGLNNTEILKKAQELLNKANNELITSSTTQWTLTATLYNLLAIPEFSKLAGMFNLGNWIRIKIDNKIYRLRLIHYRISDNDMQNLEVEFSDLTQTANGLNDVGSLLTKVQSISTNFSAVVRQAEQGEKSFTELDKIRNDGLDTSLYNISNSINQDFIIDEHGITGRKYDDILDTFMPEQVKINHNSIVWTDDYWVTAKAALGKIKYYNPILQAYIEQYGLLADAVISGILMGNDIIGGRIYSENYSTTSGTFIDLNNGDFSFAGGNLVYNTEDNILSLKGKIISSLGNIAGWEIEENRIYMLDSGMSSSSSYFAFWSGETSGLGGKLDYSDNKPSFAVTHSGRMYASNAVINGTVVTNNLKAIGGEIASWNISETLLRSSSGTIEAGTASDYVSLNNGALRFYSNAAFIASFSDTKWNGTNLYGTSVQSEVNGKFISFGNKTSLSDTLYTTKFLINYGLNPSGITKDVIVYGDLFTNSSIETYKYIINYDLSNKVNITSTFVDSSYYAVCLDNLYVRNSLYVNGANKTRVVSTANYGEVCLNAYETATPYFGDIGSGICDDNGFCYIYIDEIFKETIIIDFKYYVFLQTIGEDNPVSILEQNQDYFVVKGIPYQEFNFEIKARQKDTENSRLNVMNFEESEI